MDYTDITCPVCGLDCDDIQVSVSQAGIDMQAPECRIAERYFSAAWPDHPESVTPLIDGKTASFDDAIKRAAELLVASASPLVTGMLTDVDGARAALTLADRVGACVDHRDSQALFRNLRTVQDSGWFASTLTEVRNRADLVLLVGANLFERFPRFVQRVLAPSGLFFNQRRKVVLLGEWREDQLPAGLENCDIRFIPTPLDSVAETSGLLRLLCRGDTPPVSDITALDALSLLATELNAAAYSSVVWSSAEFDFDHAELAVESLTELVRDLNHNTRCGGLPLGGGSGGISANQTCTWQTGFPLRTSFAQGHPEHDTIRFSADRMLREREADLLIWLNSLLPDPPPETTCPSIVIGHPATRSEKPPAVYIPAAIPGIDVNGHSFRCDGVVVMPLRKLVEPRWPTMRQTVNRLMEAAC